MAKAGATGSYQEQRDTGTLVLALTGLRDFLSRTVISSPSRAAILAFTTVIAFFSLVLWLPISSADGHAIDYHHALFTATSAVTVTGLTTVTTAVQWSFFGQLMILIAFQIGGLGTLTMTSLLAMAVGRKLGLRSKLVAQEAMNIGKLGDLGSVLRTVAVTSISIEATIALILIPRFLLLGESLGKSIWHGIFYSVSAFNNAGFTAHPDGIVPYRGDLWILLPLCLGVFIGSLGFPVILVLQQTPLQFSRWNLTTKLTMIGTVVLLVIGTVLWAVFEWSNPRTIGGLSPLSKIFDAFFASTMTRSGGFSLVEMGEASPITLLITNVLMFIGGGSASTAGGIKITTVTVVFLAVVAEARGDQFVMAFNRTIPDSVLRIAISVIMMSAIIVFIGTAAIVFLSGESLDLVLFESISAYATCGLTVGLAATLPPSCIYILALLMFVGRIGIITVATGLALRSRRRLYKYPEERPIIG